MAPKDLMSQTFADKLKKSFGAKISLQRKADQESSMTELAAG